MLTKIQLENSYLYLWVLFAFVLPFSKAYPYILLIPIVLLFLLLNKGSRLFTKFNASVWFLVGSILWINFSSILHVGFIQSVKTLYKLYVLIGLIFLVGSVQAFYLKLLIAFVAGSFIQFLLSVYNMYIFYSKNGFLELATGGNVNQILASERPYLGFIMVLNVLFSLYFIRVLKTKWLYSWVIISSTFIFLISARLAMGMCFIILLHHIYLSLKHHKIYFLGGILVLMSVLCIGLVTNTNFQKRMNIAEDLSSSYQKFKAYEPRFIIWECSAELIKTINPLIGLGGASEIEQRQVDCYVSKIPESQPTKIEFYKRNAFNTHNQFLGFILQGGWVALVLFIIFFGVEFYTSRNTLFSLTLFLFFIFFIFENVLERQLGILLTGLFVGLICQKNRSLL